MAFERSKFTIGVFATLLDSSNKITLVRMGYGPRNWAQPGGALESNETPEEALKREVYEETSCQCEIERFSGVYHSADRMDITFHFVARIIKQEIFTPNDEIVEVCAFDHRKLPLDMAGIVRHRIRDALEGLSTTHYCSWRDINVFERLEHRLSVG